VLALPNQIPGMIEKYGLTRAQVDWELWAIDPAGNRWNGAAAVNRTLAELGGSWALVSALYAVAPLRRLERSAYRWIADHRSTLSRFIGAPPEWED